MPTTNANGVSLRINGILLAKAHRPSLAELEAPLRGVAMSDSPVLIRGSDTDASHLVERIRALGRRKTLPCRECRSPDQAEALFKAVLEDQVPSDQIAGTWVFHHVDAWPEELKTSLSRTLEAIDERRLHGELRHERIPRVVVLETSNCDLSSFSPDLKQRLSYFDLSIQGEAAQGTTPAASRRM